MMKSVHIILLGAALTLLLTACAAGAEEDRAETLQRQYAESAGYTARVTAAVVGEEETTRYVLDVSHSDGETRVTALEPEALAGISAVVRDDDSLALELDGMVLDAGSANPRLSAVNASDVLFRAAAEGHITERSTERFEETDGALRLCFETKLAGEKLLVTAYFDAESAPLYAELESNGEILVYLEFTEFCFCDIIPTT